MKNLKSIVLVAFVAFSVASCSVDDHYYNHCYTFDKSRFGYASGGFTVDHELSKEEQKKWCDELCRKVIESLNNNPNNHYELSDIDTAYVYLAKSF